MSKLWPLSLTLVTALFSALVLPGAALAAAGHPTIPGSELSAVWVIPFACMLLSIAIMPLALPHFWEHHFGKIAVFWGLAFLVPCLLVYGFNVALYEFLHIILLDYIPFIVLLFALFTVAGGVRLKGSLVGTPVVNTLLLAVGTVLASWMGTTGAAMLLIRPLLRANAHRKYRVHSVVFFIFLVANIGGSLTPLGDPPLFLGFLKGVSFFWTTTHLFLKTLCLSVALLAIFFVLDTVLFNKEGRPTPPHDPNAAEEKLGLDGKINLLFLLGGVLAVLASGMLPLGTWIEVFGVPVEGQNLLRDIVLLSLIGVQVVLVHGGGPEITDMLQKLGKQTQFVDGLRVTDAETADVVQMVLAGKINKTLVNLIGQKGGRAIGLSGIDGQMIQARVRDERLGYVGEITKIDVRPILDVLDKGYIPVVSTVGCDTQGHIYNINADTAAARIAGELGAESLIAMTDIGGILRDKDDPNTLIPVIHTAEAHALITSGVICGGMLPKVTCCMDAIRWGVHRVFIIDGRVPHAILIEMLTNEGIGTMFVAGQGGNANEYTAT